MEKVIANNAFEAIIAHVSYHVNYINVVANVEKKASSNVSGKSEYH